MKPVITVGVLSCLIISAANAQQTHPVSSVRAKARTATSPKAAKAQASTPVAVRDTPFPDVPKDHWAYQSVETLRITHIMRGYPAKTPNP